MSISKVAFPILFLVVTSCMGIILGNAIDSYLISAKAVRWESLGTPSEKATRIYGVDLDEIYVESATGKIFYCYIGKPQNCWVESQPRKPVSRMPPCYTTEPIGDPPGQVADRAGVCMLGPGPEYLVNYVLTADGQVWLWRYSQKTIFTGLGVEGILPGCILGFPVGVVILMLAHQPSHRALLKS